jgi:hypothetical protein
MKMRHPPRDRRFTLLRYVVYAVYVLGTAVVLSFGTLVASSFFPPGLRYTLLVVATVAGGWIGFRQARTNELVKRLEKATNDPIPRQLSAVILDQDRFLPKLSEDGGALPSEPWRAAEEGGHVRRVG